MRAAGKLGKSVRGDVTHYRTESAEARNAETSGKRFGAMRSVVQI
jgi:hypothetical protein